MANMTAYLPAVSPVTAEKTASGTNPGGTFGEMMAGDPRSGAALPGVPAAAGTARNQPRLDRYFEAEVLQAEPLKLVSLLYRGALEAITAARAALSRGDVAERSRQIVKAWAIVNELRGSLRLEQGGELAQRLHDLYAFAGQRLLDANAEQSEQPLLEAASILTTLSEAWQTLSAQQAAAEPAERPSLTLAC